MVRNRVVDFWSDLNLFNPDHFAYLSGKSTGFCIQFLACYDDWAKARNCSKSTDVILLDLSKAFDRRVPRERLFLKQNRRGMDGPLQRSELTLQRWLRQFLTNRMRRVVIGGTSSDWSSLDLLCLLFIFT